MTEKMTDQERIANYQEDLLPATLEDAAAVAHASFSTAPESVTEIGIKCTGEIRGYIHFTRYAARRIVEGKTVRQLEHFRR